MISWVSARAKCLEVIAADELCSADSPPGIVSSYNSLHGALVALHRIAFTHAVCAFGF
jgi:hypothetical protein